jgi:hypothetical protein
MVPIIRCKPGDIYWGLLARRYSATGKSELACSYTSNRTASSSFCAPTGPSYDFSVAKHYLAKTVMVLQHRLVVMLDQHRLQRHPSTLNVVSPALRISEHYHHDDRHKGVVQDSTVHVCTAGWQLQTQQWLFYTSSLAPYFLSIVVQKCCLHRRAYLTDYLVSH